jgi:outer membrane biosynthesis protein TonB
VIATSVLFLAAAIATFLVGVFSTGLQMIGASIGCSVAAALLLLVGVMRDSRKRPAIVSGGMSVSAPEMESIVSPAMPEEYAEMEPVPALEAEFASAEPLDLDAAREEFFATPDTDSYDAVPEPAPVTRATRKPAARKPAARKPAAKKAAPKKAAAKSTAKKAAPKKAAPRKPAAKSTAKKAAPKSAVAKKTAPRKPKA